MLLARNANSLLLPHCIRLKKDSSLTITPTMDTPHIPLYYTATYKDYIRALMRHRIENGGTAGYAPLGYTNCISGYKSWIEIDPKTAPLVRSLFQIVASSVPVPVAVRMVSQYGLRSKRGNLLTPATARMILLNPFYIGKVRLGNELIPGKHPTFIEEQLFEVVQGKIMV